MAGQVGDRGLIQSRSGVHIYCIYDLIHILAAIHGMSGGFELSCWREQETSIGSKGQPPKERGESLICVDIGIPGSQANAGR